MKIAVEGCAHGELDKIYESIEILQTENSVKIDLLIICGDFQAVRNPADLQCMAVPPKYRKLNTFYKYYSGEKKAPMLTIFVGGNHEASNYLSELPYGGWVCPNIYYLGYANVIRVGGVRIGGLSGIYKGRDYLKGHFECPPYNESSKKSVYHVRNVDVFRLKQLKDPIDIFISHDWPTGVYNFGNKEELLRWKSFFRDEMANNSLGSKPAEELLMKLKPSYWFAAHLHCKFAALVPHDEDKQLPKFTRFLALDKCLPRRKFLQVLDIESEGDVSCLEYDAEWLSILHSTNHLFSISKGNNFMPGKGCTERWDFTPSAEEVSTVKQLFNEELKVPDNFSLTAPCYDPTIQSFNEIDLKVYINPQTKRLCDILSLIDPLASLSSLSERGNIAETSLDPNEINLSDESNDDVETTNTDLDVSGSNFPFFIDKVGSRVNDKQNSETEAFVFPQIREESKEDRSNEEISNTPLKKFKRRNFELYKSEDSDL